jgi:hypothetical protein
MSGESDVVMTQLCAAGVTNRLAWLAVFPGALSGALSPLRILFLPGLESGVGGRKAKFLHKVRSELGLAGCGGSVVPSASLSLPRWCFGLPWCQQMPQLHEVSRRLTCPQ